MWNLVLKFICHRKESEIKILRWMFINFQLERNAEDEYACDVALTICVLPQIALFNRDVRRVQTLFLVKGSFTLSKNESKIFSGLCEQQPICKQHGFRVHIRSM